MKKANSLMQYSKKFPKRIFAYVASSRNDAFNDTLPLLRLIPSLENMSSTDLGSQPLKLLLRCNLSHTEEIFMSNCQWHRYIQQALRLLTDFTTQFVQLGLSKQLKHLGQVFGLADTALSKMATPPVRMTLFLTPLSCQTSG